MASWLISPLSTLICFLLISAWHFARAEPPSLPAAWRYCAGLWIITGSFLVYPEQTLNIFKTLIGLQDVKNPYLVIDAEALRPFQITSGLILAGLSAITIFLGRAQSTGQQILRRALALIALFLLLPPVAAVAVYFFAVHSLGETAKTLDALDDTPYNWLKVYAPASMPALFGAAGLLALCAAGLMPLPLASGLAVAFIVPHMLPLERLTQAAANQQRA